MRICEYKNMRNIFKYSHAPIIKCSNNMSDITTNKRLLYDYQVLEKWEAGLILSGSEVKAVKKGSIDLRGSYITIKTNPRTLKSEAWLIGASIAKYGKSGYSQSDYNTLKDRKLLLNRKEIDSLIGKTQQKGLTILPLSVYTTSHRLIKITIVLAKGKKKIDKRESIKKRDFDRRKNRILKN